VTTTVPEGDEVRFAIRARDGVEIMYQSAQARGRDASSSPETWSVSPGFQQVKKLL